jgi:hypothetical protein
MALNPRLWDLTVGTPARIEFGCFRIAPHRRGPQRFFQPRLSVRERDPHDCSDVSYVGGCNGGRSGFRTDRPRLRVRGDCGPDRRPSLDGADGDGQMIQPGLSEVVRHDHRAKARKVEGGARQRRPYVDVEDPGSADRARREVGRPAADHGARLLGLHGYGPGTLRLGDRQAQYREQS